MSCYIYMQAQYSTGTVLFQLVRLELCSCEDNWTNMLASVLQHSPKLACCGNFFPNPNCVNFSIIFGFWFKSVMHLSQNHWLAVDRKVCWMEPSCVPECLLFHLKTLEWRDYEGTKVEKEVAIYILKNARRLVTATIYHDSVNMSLKHQMFEELEIATRNSRACELTMG